ncbi:MAG: hypothetical protein JW969_06695 [Spirochaetales bacterium]|nr:hypothetical protein [Spirochaetales bacterium]
MNNSIESRFNITLNHLLEEEHRITDLTKSYDILYAGLKDIDLHYQLINLKFRIALHVTDFIMAEPDKARVEPYFKMARGKAREAVHLLETITDLNISLDQQDQVRQAPGYGEAKQLFQDLLLKGGAAFFEQKEADGKKQKEILKAVSSALSKHALSREDNYETTFKTENLPGWLRKLVLLFLPVFAKENKKDPPYGIEEGEEEYLSSKKIKLPLSQAIYYIENELIPSLKNALENSPGDALLQERIARVTEELETYKKVKYFPRSIPLILERNFHTDGINQYSENGEMLVTVNIPVFYKSGTNMDRIREMVESDIVRKLAGKGVDEKLDEEYRHLKKLESGIRGNSRTPGFKLDTRLWYSRIKQSHPLLKSLDNKESLQKYIELFRKKGRRKFEKYIEQEIRQTGALINPF